jgi:hypothetical protein
MRLKERECAAIGKVMWNMAEAAAVPPKGIWRFWEEGYSGMVVGFKGRQGPEDCVPLLWGSGLCKTGIAPCLFFKWEYWIFYAALSREKPVNRQDHKGKK